MEVVGRQVTLFKEGPLTKKQLPKGEGHGVALCLACRAPFKVGQYFVALPLGPGGDAEQRALCREGEDYVSVTVDLHWDCATGGSI